MKINEKNLCVFASSPPYDREGFLNKRGEVNRAFQRRYFVLKGNLLFYFEKKGDKEPLGLIIVEGCTIELSEESDQYCFEIAFNGNRTYVLSADSQENMESWMKALTCAGYEYKKLIVAELQRKLNEIEDSKNKVTSESMAELANVSIPKPPPRRQNPFNRPAPPPPNSNGNDVNSMPFINDHYSNPQPSTSTAVQLEAKQYNSCPKPPRRSVASTAVNTIISPSLKRSEFYVQTQRQQAQQSLLSETSGAIKYLSHTRPNSQSPVEKFKGTQSLNSFRSFEERHEKFRQLIMKDVLAYHTQRELKNRPLIEL